jgi:hypothetical protein
MYSFDSRGRAELETELNGGHFDFVLGLKLEWASRASILDDAEVDRQLVLNN